MTAQWTIEVYSQPRPKGSWTVAPRKGARFLFERGARFYQPRDMVLIPASDKALGAWVNAVSWAARCADPPPAPINGPWYCGITFWFRPPASRAGEKWAIGHKRESSGRTSATGDEDKLRRGVLDVLTGVFWPDDRLVCDGAQTKRYCTSRKPGATIVVRFLGDDQLFL